MEATQRQPLLADCLDDDELCAELGGIARRTLERWRAKRIAPPHFYIGQTPYTHRTVAQQWLLDRARENTAPVAKKRGWPKGKPRGPRKQPDSTAAPA